MNRILPRFPERPLLILLCGTVCLLPDGAADEQISKAPDADLPSIPLYLQPYRVLVELACSDTTTSLEISPQQLRQEVEQAIRRMYGEMWQAEIRISSWLVPGSMARLGRLESDPLLHRYPESDAEKVMFVSIERSDGGWLVSCREYDVRMQELTPTRSERTLDPRGIAVACARQMRDSFRPVLLLTAAAQGTDELEFFLQAGELPPPDPSAAQIADGDVMRPFLRHMERREPDKLRLLQRLDLTYIRITEFNRDLNAGGISPDDTDVTAGGQSADDTAQFQDRARVRGVLISHGSVPYGGRGRNVQQMALRQRPLAASSRVRLVLRLRPDRPLICHRIDQFAKLRWRDETVIPPQRLISDRNGEIEIQTDPENPTFWLYIYSGSLFLARVPYAPGLMEADIIKLPDDSIRLAVEGELYLFRDQLVDVVAQRAVLRGIARQAATAGDKNRLEEAIRQMEGLPGKREFDGMLNAIRVPAINRARALRNRNAERQIDKLCGEMANSLDEFFKTQKQIQELQEIQRYRSLVNEQAAAGAF